MLKLVLSLLLTIPTLKAATRGSDILLGQTIEQTRQKLALLRGASRRSFTQEDVEEIQRGLENIEGLLTRASLLIFPSTLDVAFSWARNKLPQTVLYPEAPNARVRIKTRLGLTEFARVEAREALLLLLGGNPERGLVVRSPLVFTPRIDAHTRFIERLKGLTYLLDQMQLGSLAKQPKPERLAMRFERAIACAGGLMGAGLALDERDYVILPGATLP